MLSNQGSYTNESVDLGDGKQVPLDKLQLLESRISMRIAGDEEKRTFGFENGFISEVSQSGKVTPSKKRKVRNTPRKRKNNNSPELESPMKKPAIEADKPTLNSNSSNSNLAVLPPTVPKTNSSSKKSNNKLTNWFPKENSNQSGIPFAELQEKDKQIKELQALYKESQKENERLKQESGKEKTNFESLAKAVSQSKANQIKTLIDEFQKLRKFERDQLRQDVNTMITELGRLVVWNDKKQYERVAKLKMKLQELKDMKLPHKKSGESLEIARRNASLALKRKELKAEKERLTRELEKYEEMQAIYELSKRKLDDENMSRYLDHQILHDRYILLRMLGKGGFAEVWKAYDIDLGILVAVKINRINHIWKEEQKQNYIKHVQREYVTHKNLECDTIVQLRSVFNLDNGEAFVTVMDYCEGKDLDWLLKVKKRLPESIAYLIAIQMLEAIVYMHASGVKVKDTAQQDETRKQIIHFDLKPANVLFVKEVSESYDIKITDFGLCKMMEENEANIDMTSVGAGTYWYLPPEAFEEDKISPKVDIWSFGVIFYQMLCGKRPFAEGESQHQIYAQKTILRQAEQSLLQFPEHLKISDEAKDIIKKCLTIDPASRPSANDLASEKYFNNPPAFKN